MRRYVIKRLFLIIPSLLILSLVVFFLSRMTPGDPVKNLIELRGQHQQEMNTANNQEIYTELAHELGLDKPLFYFSIQPSLYPDTFYRIQPPEKKNVLKKRLLLSKDWQKIQDFEMLKESFILSINSLNDSLLSQEDKNKYNQLNNYLSNELDKKGALERISSLEEKLEANNYYRDKKLENSFKDLKTRAVPIFSTKQSFKSLLPVFKFHGTNNQYHHWFASVLKLDFGLSVSDANPVTKKVADALFWTFLYIILAYIFSLSIAIPLGLYTAWKHNRWIEKFISSLSFLFYALPLFWLATLGVVFLTNSNYADWLNIFPSAGIGRISSSMTWWEKASTAMPHLILPALILGLHGSASGIRIIRNSTIVELKSAYFITAKAKGLKNIDIVLKHIFPNAMLPIVTMLVSGFPSAFAGSVILEVIFNIPGMGRLLFDSIHYMDWNVVFAILLFIGLFTFIFYLIGDLLYAFLNPKIKYEKA